MTRPASSEENPAGYQGFGENFLGLVGSFSGYVHARLKLLQIESKEALVHVVVIVALLAAAVCLVVLGYIFLAVALAVLVQIWTGANWAWVLFGFAAAHLVLAVIAVLVARARFSRRIFGETIDQLQRDREWLSRDGN